MAALAAVLVVALSIRSTAGHLCVTTPLQRNPPPGIPAPNDATYCNNLGVSPCGAPFVASCHRRGRGRDGVDLHVRQLPSVF